MKNNEASWYMYVNQHYYANAYVKYVGNVCNCTAINKKTERTKIPIYPSKQSLGGVLLLLKMNNSTIVFCLLCL